MKWLRLSGVLVALAMAAAACSGSPQASSDASEQTLEDQLVEWQRCMREQGIEAFENSDGEGPAISIGGPAGGDPAGGGDPELRAAMEACEDKRPTQGAELSEEERAAMEDQRVEFAKCMREHGIDMPDPSSDGGGTGFSPEQAESEEFKQANEACKDKLPNRVGPSDEEGS